MNTDFLTNKEKQPTLRQVYKLIDKKKVLWDDFVRFIRKNYYLKPEFKLMGKTWVLWVRKSSRTLVTLHPKENSFVIQIVLGRKEVEETKNMKFSKIVQDVYNKAKQYHDGKWLFIEISSKVEVEDCKTLMLIKRKPVKR